MKKKNVLIIMAMVFALVLAGCGNNASSNTENNANNSQTETSQQTETSESAGLQEFTLEELAAYNGKDGNKAYIAVDGKVYDVTDSPAWANGGHNGFEAGQDLTEAIKKAPHGLKVLDSLTQVGTLK